MDIIKTNMRGKGGSSILITGGEGRVGKRLKVAFPNAKTLDLIGAPDFHQDLLDMNIPLPPADIIFHLAGLADPSQPFEAYADTLRMGVRVAASGHTVVFASSVWVNRLPLSPYGVVKRAIENMVYESGGAIIRLGCVGATETELENADAWVRANVWSDDQLCDAFRRSGSLFTEDPL